MERLFKADHLEDRYRYLNLLPDSLYNETVTLSHGTLSERVHGVLAWRKCLLDGRLPSYIECNWPEIRIYKKLFSQLEEWNIARFCNKQEELTDNFLQSILSSLDNTQASLATETTAIFNKLKRLEEMERSKIEVKETKKPKLFKHKTTPDIEQQLLPDGDLANMQARYEISSPPSSAPSATPEPPVVIPDEVINELMTEAEQQAKEASIDKLLSMLNDEWEERIRVWSELANVFNELDGLLGRGFDLSSGLLQSQGWFEMVKLRKLMENLPQLKEVIRALGRMQLSENDYEPVAETIFSPVQRTQNSIREFITPLAPMETNGVRRSDEFIRMLPSEAAFLGHPTLNMLWHARRAEQALLTYKVEGVMSEHVQSDVETLEERQQMGKKQRLERGPIIVCLDTSGSMHGTPETVAKALTLEAMRIALKERRRCYLYAFSGPGEVIEHELQLTKDGLADFLKFLLFSFHGGTDIYQPFTRALDKLKEEEWNKSDIILVSDGEFSVPSSVTTKTNEAKNEYSLRTHGVLIGNYHRASMDKVCDNIHVFTEWRSLTP